MLRIYTYLTMMTGSFLVFTTGCVTGTHTFSSIGIPATQYCSTGDQAAPVFDIPATEFPGASLSVKQAVGDDGQKIRLNP